MKVILLIGLIFWMILTIILCCSIIGLLLLAPVQNDTAYHMPMTNDRRSTWMLIGLDLKNNLIK